MTTSQHSASASNTPAAQTGGMSVASTLESEAPASGSAGLRQGSPAASATPYRPTRRTVIGALWLFTILNYAYCDILGTHDVNYLNGILSGDDTGGSVQLTPMMLLWASVLMTIPISSVLVTRIAGHGLARWWSVAAGVIMTLVQIGSLFVGETTVYYAYFSAIEIPSTALIAWLAVRWTREG